MKHFSLICGLLGVMFITTSECWSQNIFTDGDFSVSTEITPISDSLPPADTWCSWLNVWNGVDAYPAVVDGVCKYQINFPGYNSWDIQLIQYGFELVQDHAYRLTFDVKATADRYIGVFLGEEGGTWFNYLGSHYNQWVTTDWQTITLEFKAGKTFPAYKFSLEMGIMYGDLWFDNIMLEDLGYSPPQIGIVGTAVSDWNTDVFMTTTDDITYTLTNYPLKGGELKFRQDADWSINWGSDTFPVGTGVQDGPNIPIYAPGNYDITFNRFTGEYSFECVSDCAAAVTFVGTAVPPAYNWSEGLPMRTFDGEVYMLWNLMLTDGEALFRVEGDPEILYGATTFPNGTAVAGGDPIPIPAAHYEVFFDLNTLEYHFAFPNLGILGSALNGWDTDIDMETTDGIIYTLKDHPFSEGYIKFRLNDNWEVNWGGYGFPNGYAWFYGPDIPVMAGTYDLTFNIMTGEFFFVATSCPIAGIQCPDFIYTENSWGECGAWVYYPDVTAAPNCGGDGVTIVQTEGLPSGSFFPVGYTTNTFVLTNEAGDMVTCSFDIMVYDWEPPVIENIVVNTDLVWPPNHQMIPVEIEYTISDNCGMSYAGIYVWSSEEDDATGDGNTSIDYEIIDEHHLLLRAERSGKGIGRNYYVVIYSWDESWNTNYQIVQVFIPHDMGMMGKAGQGTTGLKSAELYSPHMEGPALQIWPNPSNQHFNLDFRTLSNDPVTFTLFSSDGRMLMQQEISGTKPYVFGDDLIPGVYYVSVKNGPVMKSVKIIKQ